LTDNDIDKLQAIRIRGLLEVLSACESVMTDEKRSLNEQQRAQRIFLEAVDKISKMRDLGSKEDDLAKILEKLTKLVGKGNGNGKAEAKT